MKRKIGNTTIDILPPVKRYMNAIERRLRVDGPTRLRIMTELAGDFESRRESGQSDEQIMAELGTPAQVAAQFNAAFGAPRLDRRWRWAFVAAAVLVAALAVLPGLLPPDEATSVGVIGGADGPTSIYVTASPNQNLVSIFPWLLGCAGGFLLPVWRRPRSGQGGGRFPAALRPGTAAAVYRHHGAGGCGLHRPAARRPAGCRLLGAAHRIFPQRRMALRRRIGLGHLGPAPDQKGG